jgi:hypothetical protein
MKLQRVELRIPRDLYNWLLDRKTEAKKRGIKMSINSQINEAVALLRQYVAQTETKGG